MDSQQDDSTISLTENKENKEYLEKLNQYYSLKKNYETKKQEKKMRILRNDNLSMRQKQEAYSKLKMNCFNCGRRVGTIFKNEDGVLYAICGDKANPCILDIKINTGKFVDLKELVDIFQVGVDELKESIIIIKLNLLFGYSNEADTLKKFNFLKKELADDLESLMEYKTKMINILDNIQNKGELAVEINRFNKKIELIKNTMDEFDETGKIQLIKDMIDVYQLELIPIINKIVNLKYKYFAMEKIDDDHHLIKKVFTLQELLDPFSDPTVESFEINSTKVKRTDDDDDDDIQVNNSGLNMNRRNNDDFEWKETEKETTKEKEKTTSSKPVLKQEKKGNDTIIMFGDKEIINKSAYDVNTNIIKNNPKISIDESNKKQKYQHEMIYISPHHPDLVAIDKNTGKIYVVDFPSLKKKNEQSGKDSLSSNSSSTIIPPPPSGTPESVSSTSPIEPPPARLINKKSVSSTSPIEPPPAHLINKNVSSTSPIEPPPAHLINKGILVDDDEDYNIGD